MYPTPDPTAVLQIRKFEHPLPHPRMPYVGAQIIHIPSRKVVAEFVDPRLAELFMQAAHQHNGLIERLNQLGRLSQDQAQTVEDIEYTLDLLRPLRDEAVTAQDIEQYHGIADFAEKQVQTNLYQGTPVSNPLKPVQTAMETNKPSKPIDSNLVEQQALGSNESDGASN